jgi:hypothetical protein
MLGGNSLGESTKEAKREATMTTSDSVIPVFASMPPVRSLRPACPSRLWSTPHCTRSFDVEHHRAVVVMISDAVPSGPAALACRATLTAVGHSTPVEFTAHVTGTAYGTVTLSAELAVDRTRFGMTWNPLRIAATQARATVTARFIRQ